jgi:hypothetical protein
MLVRTVAQFATILRVFNRLPIEPAFVAAVKSKRRAPEWTRAWQESTTKSLVPLYRPKYAAFFAVYSFHFSGRSSSAKMADTGHTGTHAPQSMHSTGSM